MSSDDEPAEPESSPHITAVVLAAGRGERLQSVLPKPAHPICGRPMASHVLRALAVAGISNAVVVTPNGKRGELVRQAFCDDHAPLDLRFAVQDEPLGTAASALAAQSLVHTAHVLIINGDLPLVTAEQIEPIANAPDADAVIATAHVDDPAKMGRILRDADGRLHGIVEFSDASPAEKRINEVNLGWYRFRADFLWPGLEQIVKCANERRNSEAYVTDALPIAVQRGSAAAVAVDLPDGRLNVETPADAARAESIIQRRITDQLLDDGIQIRDPGAVWIDASVKIAPGAAIEPGAHIRGSSQIGKFTRIGPNAIIEDARVGERCTLESCTVRGSVLRDDVEVGPYSTIRPRCEIGSHVHIGTHAELKAAAIGEHVQIGHFSYLGDVEVGARANIGAGAITCNFDGTEKHRTIIGEGAFIGSDTMLIAPVRVGDRASTGAGAVVTKDVPDDGNAVGHPARLTPRRARTAHSDSEAERG